MTKSPLGPSSGLKSRNASVSARVTVPMLLSRKGGPKITAVTAYDFQTAMLIDKSGMDLILVGDSLGSVVQGLETTIPVTLEEVIYHTRCVARAVKRALLVADMPFMSYQASIESALVSAGRLLKEGGAAAVKLEGGVHMRETIERLVQIDIPVLGHVGLTPQSYHRMGGHKLQGKRSGSITEAGSRERIVADAKAVEVAGAFGLVIEGVPRDLASEITSSVDIPTLGIGAGTGCDGQIQVINDILGMDPDFTPRHSKRFANLSDAISQALGFYRDEVQSGAFPANEPLSGSITSESQRAAIAGKIYRRRVP